MLQGMFVSNAAGVTRERTNIYIKNQRDATWQCVY